MGTDMTTFVEIWDDEEKKWKFVTKQHALRSYISFGRIGGVRDNYQGNYNYHCRGIPDGISDDTERSLKNNEYYHSITYYSAKELLKTVIGHKLKYDEDEEAFPITFGIIMGDWDGTGAWDVMMKALIDHFGKKNIRFIFAFDS